MKHAILLLALFGFLFGSINTQADEWLDSLSEGNVELRSAGQMTFGPSGILFIADPMNAKVYAIDTGDRESSVVGGDFAVKNINGKLAQALGTDAEGVRITDMAINPMSGRPYMSVARGNDAVIMKLSADGELSELSLKNVKHSAASIPNAPGEDEKYRGRSSKRAYSVTDISLVDNQVVVAGLSNEEFSSNLRAIPFPFSDTPRGAALEVYHGVHGKYETHAPIRTFTTISLDDEPYVVAAYTCTPLVRFPLKSIGGDDKIRGVTVAELGNRNVPLDMFVYKKDGEKFILMNNSARGTMKISTEDIGRDEGITERVSKAGQTYDTIDGWDKVVQLDRLNETHAMIMIANEDGSLDLKAIALP